MPTAMTTKPESEPTAIRPARVQDWFSGRYPTDYLWFAAMDPAGKAKLLITISANNVPFGAVSVNLTTPEGEYSNLLDCPATSYRKGLEPHLFIRNRRLSFEHDESRDAYHLVLDDVGITADLWFSATAPGAAMDLNWDGQRVFWSSPIGTAEVNGSIRYPGERTPRKVSGWVGETERMAGWFTHLAGHRGYDYCQSGNPDGSADQLFVFPLLRGGWRGIMAHTPAPGRGETTMWADPEVTVSDWTTVGKYRYPARVTGAAAGHSITFTVTDVHVFPALLETTTMSDGYTNVPGSVATIQHLRNLGTGFLGWQPGPYLTQLPSLLTDLRVPPAVERLLRRRRNR